MTGKGMDGWGRGLYRVTGGPQIRDGVAQTTCLSARRRRKRRWGGVGSGWSGNSRQIRAWTIRQLARKNRHAQKSCATAGLTSRADAPLAPPCSRGAHHVENIGARAFIHAGENSALHCWTSQLILIDCFASDIGIDFQCDQKASIMFCEVRP